MGNESDKTGELKKKVAELEETLKLEQAKADILNKMLEIGRRQAEIDGQKKSTPTSLQEKDPDDPVS